MPYNYYRVVVSWDFDITPAFLKTLHQVTVTLKKYSVAIHTSRHGDLGTVLFYSGDQ